MHAVAESKHQQEGVNHECCSLRYIEKDALGNPIWVEAVEDLRKATVRIEELALDSPGEYIVFNQQTSQIITTAVSMRVEWCGAEAADC
jgi:hypothetical protein